MNFVSKNPIEAALAEALAGVTKPAWVIDAHRGLLVGANGRGNAVWGVPVMALALDSAIPTLRALRARLTSRPASAVSSGLPHASTELLRFWTGAGARAVPCEVRLLDDSVGPGLMLVVAETGPGSRPRFDRKGAQLDAQMFWDVSADRTSSAPPAREPPALPPRAPQVASNAGVPLSDAETLREIARRIRQGSAGLPNGRANDQEIPDGREDRSAEGPMPIRQDVEPIGGGEATALDLPSHLAHEIRTPLAAIISLAEVITEERLGPWPNDRYRDYIRDILESARHGLEVVDDILRNAANQPGAAPVVAEIDLNADVEAICTSLQPLAEKSGARLEAALVSGLPRVTADRRNIRQMLLNLISNSIKHGGTAVRIKVTTGYELGGDVWVEVEDNGPGFNVTDAGLPEKGVRGNDRRRKAGLGLPLTRALATANGARLDISSRPGRGVRARIVFNHDRAAMGRG